jgi:uncharacterized protein YycO
MGRKTALRRRLVTLLVIVILIVSTLKLADYLDKGYESSGRHAPIWITLLANSAHGHLGTGDFSNPNQLDFSQLQPGDIILVGNAGGSYGRYTHAAIYVGNDQAIDMYISTGVYLTSLDAYHDYRWAAILRVKATKTQKVAAVDYSLKQLGLPFFILAPRNNDGLWYCSKLVWQAYARQGIDLDPYQDYWITPDDLQDSPKIQLIANTTSK